MFKRKLVLFSCLIIRRDGAVVVQSAMLISTRARNLPATVAKYLPDNHQLLAVIWRRPHIVEVDGTVPSHAPLTMAEVIDHAARGSLVFGGRL